MKMWKHWTQKLDRGSTLLNTRNAAIISALTVKLKFKTKFQPPESIITAFLNLMFPGQVSCIIAISVLKEIFLNMQI